MSLDSNSQEQTKLQRKRIPATLHSELSEYSSLLRAIRTNDSLDVTSQLTRYFSNKGKDIERPLALSESDEDYQYHSEDEDSEEENASGDEAGFGRRAKLSSQGSKKTTSRLQSQATEESIASTKDPTPRENWTRWPLLVQDVPPPEWTLRDEVANIATFLLPRTNSSTDDDLESENCFDPEIDPSVSQMVTTMTLSSLRYLDSILASLAAIIPERPSSMINRLAPAGWQTVLAALQIQAASRSLDETSIKTLERVQNRLADLYGVSSASQTTLPLASSSSTTNTPSQPPPTSDPQTHSSPQRIASPYLSDHRIQILQASSSKLTAAFSSHHASPSDLLSLDFGYPGIGYSLPEGWTKDWLDFRAQEKKKKRKADRKQEEGRKSQHQNAERSATTRRKSTRLTKRRQIDLEENAEDVGLAAVQDEDLVAPDDDQWIDEDWDGVGHDDGVEQQLVSRPGKRRRSKKEEHVGSDYSDNSSTTRKRKIARSELKTAQDVSSHPKQLKRKPKPRYKSAKFIDSD
ncbi:hypothetical protein C8R42DRAFT_724958 [Lentinula raphanica]|nr:hypothetical protein C8R42DRAFT_724958 [Lentinula raphanica]